MRRLTVVLGLLGLLVGLGAAPALAVAPLRVSSQITDQAQVLQGGDRARVQSAMEELRQRTGIRLSVVYVDGFSGVAPGTWAERTWQQSGLGKKDVLLAVAVKERHVGTGAGDDVSRSQVTRVLDDEVKPKLAAQDWAGAAVAMADGLKTKSGAGSGLATFGTVLVLLLLAGGGYLFFRSRRRRRERNAEQAALPAPQQPTDPYAGTPTDQLNGRASQELLDLDERVRTAQVDLDYARAYYGEDAVPGYRQALERAGQELAQAFTIRQELDDDIPEDEPTTRRMLADLLRLTSSANERLRAQTEAVDQLRERERTAPQAMEELDRRIRALQQRLPQEEQRLGQLGARYAGSALAAVADNVNQAGVRLGAAAQALQTARQEQASGQAGRAVARLRPAEEAVRQAGTLLDAIERMATDLAAAEQQVADARAETEADLAEARALAASGNSGELRARIARAEAALASADAAVRPRDGGLPDPLGALRRLESADAELRQTLQSARDAQTQARKAAEALDQSLLTARSAVAAAGDFISTRRGAVGPEARTRLAEAQRHLDAAVGQAQRDPVSALREAQQADQLAQYALDVAQRDVEQWSQQTGYGPGYGGPAYGGGYGPGWGGGGGFGGGFGGARYGGGMGRSLGWGLGGLMLGGLLFGDHDRDEWAAGYDGGADYGGGFDGGFGGGDFGGGDFGGGDFGGGDFGGGGDF